MCGYKNKYLRIAIDINEKYGYTVICSSNPFDGINPLDNAMDVINSYCNNKGYNDYEIYYMGHSAGGLIGLWYGVNYEKIKRILSINAPLMYNYHKTKDGIKRFKGDRLVLVYGSLDQSINYTELVKPLESDIIKLVNDMKISENIDSIIIAEKPKMRKYIAEMCKNISEKCDIPIDKISIKATTEEGLGFSGKGEGIAAKAVTLIK